MVYKGCTRCGGDLFNERDVGHTDLVCLQCGYRETVFDTSILTRLAAAHGDQGSLDGPTATRRRK